MKKTMNRIRKLFKQQEYIKIDKDILDANKNTILKGELKSSRSKFKSYL